MRTRRLLAWVAVVALGLGAACSLPAEEKPFPPQDEDLEQVVEELNREAERRMEEMMRENEELFSQFSEDEPLRLAPIGDG